MYAGLLRLAQRGVIAGVVNLVIVIFLYYGDLFQETQNLQMAGLARGCVIPRLQVGKHNGSRVRDGLSGDSAHSAGRIALASDELVEGCESHQRT